MGIVVTRVSISGLGKLYELGELFGTHFLNPLLEQNEAPVVASYGPSGSGKSIFGRAAAMQLPPFFARHADKVHRPSSSTSELDVTDDCRAFRYRDFGPATVGQPEPGLMQDVLRWLPRKDMGKFDTRYTQGLDLLEHPSSPHLAGSDIVLLIRPLHRLEQDMLGAGRYFSIMENGIAGYNVGDRKVFDGEYYCDNPRTATILSEMRRLKELTVNPSESIHARKATLILTNSRPDYSRAFTNFSKALGFA